MNHISDKGICVIRPFLEVYALHEFGNDGIHVRISFAVCMRQQILRHIVEENEVCAMVQI